MTLNDILNHFLEFLMSNDVKSCQCQITISFVPSLVISNQKSLFYSLVLLYKDLIDS